MTLLGFPLGVLLLGLGALAALLYALQRLRVQHEEVPVVTTQFWKAAVEETRARVLTRKFMHPWAYALILAIAALIWIAMAEPETQDAGTTRYVLLLDGSAGMTRAGRFALAVDAIEDAASDLPRESTSVLFCAGGVRTLLAPGESPLLLEARLDGLEPEAAPASVARTIRRLGAMGGDVVCRVFGDAPVPPAAVSAGPVSSDLAESHVRVERAPLDGPLDETNRSITALGVSEPMSGAWDTVDVLVEVRGNGLGGLALDVPGVEGLVSERDVADAHTLRVVYRDVPADGRVFVVSLPTGDGLPIDDTAEIRLPSRRPIRVALSASMKRVFGPVLAADPAVVIASEESADIAVRRRGESIGGDVPAIELVDAKDQPAAFHMTDPSAAEDADEALRAVTATLALDEIDARSLAETAGRTIEATIEGGPRRTVALWVELLGEPYDFVPSRAFPVFVAHAVRWLADVPDTAPYVAAGEPYRVTGPLQDADGRVVDPLGLRYTPERAGTFTLGDGRAVAAALLDPSLVAAGGGDSALAPGSGPGGSSSLVTILLLMAFALVLVEWHLYRTGRMP